MCLTAQASLIFNNMQLTVKQWSKVKGLSFAKHPHAKLNFIKFYISCLSNQKSK